MKTNRILKNSMAVLTAFIWGTSFVAQSIAADHLSPFTFNAARSAVAFVFLLILGIGQRFFHRMPEKQSPHGNPNYYRDLFMGGFLCGAALTIGTNLQQKGIETTTSGKAGFLTALYIVIVPILGVFLRKKVHWNVWISIAVAVAGLYFLCIQENFGIARGDFLILLCSLCFAVQILLVDFFVQKVSGIDLSCVQFLCVTILSGIGMAATEAPTLAALKSCLWPVLYVGVFSSGVAYTLQILAQKGSNPTVISLLLSLESVFAALAGAVILHDRMSGREYFGCVLMFAAVILSQIPVPERKNKSPDHRIE